MAKGFKITAAEKKSNEPNGQPISYDCSGHHPPNWPKKKWSLLPSNWTEGLALIFLKASSPEDNRGYCWRPPSPYTTLKLPPHSILLQIWWVEQIGGQARVPCPASPTYNIDQHLLNKATLLHGMTTMKATLNAPHGIIYSFKIIGIRGAEISIYGVLLL